MKRSTFEEKSAHLLAKLTGAIDEVLSIAGKTLD